MDLLIFFDKIRLLAKSLPPPCLLLETINEHVGGVAAGTHPSAHHHPPLPVAPLLFLSQRPKNRRKSMAEALDRHAPFTLRQSRSKNRKKKRQKSRNCGRLIADRETYDTELLLRTCRVCSGGGGEKNTSQRRPDPHVLLYSRGYER